MANVKMKHFAQFRVMGGEGEATQPTGKPQTDGCHIPAPPNRLSSFPPKTVSAKKCHLLLVTSLHPRGQGAALADWLSSPWLSHSTDLPRWDWVWPQEVGAEPRRTQRVLLYNSCLPGALIPAFATQNRNDELRDYVEGSSGCSCLLLVQSVSVPIWFWEGRLHSCPVPGLGHATAFRKVGLEAPAEGHLG